jgi:AraC family transcriptional regulator
MSAPPSQRDTAGELAPGAEKKWLGNSVWQVPGLEISGIKSWGSITAMSFRRGAGETIWWSDHHRIILIPDPHSSVVVQVEQGRTRQLPIAPPGTLSFYPAGLTVRVASPAARFVHAVWDPGFYSILLPELGTAASRFEYLGGLQDPLLSQIVTALAQETKRDFADRVLGESLGTALFICLARRFVGHLLLPTSNGLSPERLQRVRDYVEAHLDEDLSLTVLADIACLSPYHFSRSLKQAVGVGPQRYVIQRRLERAKRLLRQTRQPLALVAQQAGFADQSHLTQMFRRETGVTPGRYRAALA